jgi:hypothetical protein
MARSLHPKKCECIRRTGAGQKFLTVFCTVPVRLIGQQQTSSSVLDAHFTAHPHPMGKTWPGVLTFYRAAATHDAYFDWSQREDLYTILRVTDHLQKEEGVDFAPRRRIPY